jgi:hypothetical protein
VEHFAEVCSQVQHMIKEQLRKRTGKSVAQRAGLSDEKKGVIDDILNNLQVHPVSALQYRRILTKDPDDPWFIKDESQSNMPQLIEALRNITRLRSKQQRGHLDGNPVAFSGVSERVSKSSARNGK